MEAGGGSPGLGIRASWTGRKSRRESLLVSAAWHISDAQRGAKHLTNSDQENRLEKVATLCSILLVCTQPHTSSILSFWSSASVYHEINYLEWSDICFGKINLNSFQLEHKTINLLKLLGIKGRWPSQYFALSKADVPSVKEKGNGTSTYWVPNTHQKIYPNYLI